MKLIAFALAVLALIPVSISNARETPSDTQAIAAAMQAIDPEIAPDQYESAAVDLDGDGGKDALVLMNGKSGYCGSGGCTLFVLRANGTSFTEIGKIPVVRQPIYLRESSHHGLRDILVAGGGGGASPGFAALAFDGTSYPTSPGGASSSVEATDTIAFSPPDAAVAAEGFDKTGELFGITFRVTSPNVDRANFVTITPSGLKNDNSEKISAIDGKVVEAEVADLNMDGSPEIYVYGKSNDPGGAGSLVAYSANSKASLSQIYLPPLADDPKNSQGYRGGDEFTVIENVLGRRFPVYPDDKSISRPTGRLRQLQYKLKKGEAGWVLRLDKVTEF
jgi:hypothetical protein